MIGTERLVLRTWRDGDLPAFAAMCADPEVMRHLGGPQPLDRAAATVARERQAQAAHGMCFWAIERRADGAFIGLCGIRPGGHPGTPVAGDLEIGWRLARDAWGQGYGAEAARAALAWAWANTPRDRIAAWTVPANTRSWGLMARIGMARRADLDFDHPAFPPGHELRRHVVYVAERP